MILKLKWDIFKNKLLSVKKESSLKIAVIFLFIVGYAAGSFYGLVEAFDYINTEMGFGYVLIDRLFYVFFLVLFLMLTTSQIIITYSSFYRSSETEFLFSFPLKQTSVFAIKFIESTFLSSWAFAFLSLPLFLAYGAGRSLNANFYVIGMFLSLFFILITAGIGTGFTVLLVRYFPGRIFKILAGIALTAGISGFVYYSRVRRQINWNSGDLGLMIDQLLRHTNVSLYPLLPSCWISKGLLNVISKNWEDVLFYFLMLFSTAIFFVWLCLKAGGKMYFLGWLTIKTGQKTKYYKPGRNTGFLCKWQAWNIISKDSKLFRRDPVQWSQFAIFFGMIAIYIFNMRNMQYDIDSIFWKNLLSFLNMGTVILTLGTLGTRFIYPQMSIECKRMWIITLSPVSMGRVLMMKYASSVVMCSLITVGLITISNIMLKVPSYMVWISVPTMILAAITLPALALGLGSVFPNLKEDDMAKIVAGFGGTLTLVLSLLYIVVILGVEILPVHLYYTKHIIQRAVFVKYMSISCGMVIFISLLSAIVPLVWGYKRLKNLEV